MEIVGDSDESTNDIIYNGRGETVDALRDRVVAVTQSVDEMKKQHDVQWQDMAQRVDSTTKQATVHREEVQRLNAVHDSKWKAMEQRVDSEAAVHRQEVQNLKMAQNTVEQRQHTLQCTVGTVEETQKRQRLQLEQLTQDTMATTKELPVIRSDVKAVQQRMDSVQHRVDSVERQQSLTEKWKAIHSTKMVHCLANNAVDTMNGTNAINPLPLTMTPREDEPKMTSPFIISKATGGTMTMTASSSPSLESEHSVSSTEMRHSEGNSPLKRRSRTPRTSSIPNLSNLKIPKFPLNVNGLGAIDGVNQSEVRRYRAAMVEMAKSMVNPKKRDRVLPDILGKTKRLRSFIENTYSSDDKPVVVLSTVNAKWKQRIEEYFDPKYNRWRSKSCPPTKSAVIVNHVQHRRVKVPQEEMIEKYRIKRHSRISKLNGQFGVRAVAEIGSDVVIGEYYGHYILDQDMGQYIPCGGREREYVDEYMFEYQLEAEMTRAQAESYGVPGGGGHGEVKPKVMGSPPLKKRKLGSGQRGKSTVKRGFNIILDAYHVNGRRSVLTFINDCQRDLALCANPTAEDMKCVNVRFVMALINGWPRWFGITLKKIPAKQELVNDFGSDYGRYLHSDAVCERRRQLMREDIQRILDKHGIKEDIIKGVV